MSEPLNLNDYQEAIFVQSACNLIAIINSFNKVLDKIFYEARMNGKGTDWINKHPICRLYAEQIIYLSGSVSYSEAYNEIESIINKLTNGDK
jgi:hypothetical protein